jgi:APA family basic amino acid/polyamine antiporter
MVQDGDLPDAFGRVHERHGVPWTAAILLGAIAAALVPLGGVAAVASLSSFAALLGFVAVNGCVIVLRYRAPARRRPFRVPLAVGRFPLFPALGLLSAGLLLLHFEPATYVGGGAALALGLALYAGRRAWKWRKSR